MVGLTSLITDDPPMPPKLNRECAKFVLAKIDEILAWEQRKEKERDTKFVDLGRYLCEVRAGQYWRVENVKSFDEFLERRFPGSRRKAYYLMSIHENLPPEVRQGAEGSGLDEGAGAGETGEKGEEALHKYNLVAQSSRDADDEFRPAIEKELMGRETEPWEIVYFKLYESQIPVVDRAIETAPLTLGSDRSRGYCLEMIRANFLAGANLDNGDPETLLFSMKRFFGLLPEAQKQTFVESILAKAS